MSSLSVHRGGKRTRWVGYVPVGRILLILWKKEKWPLYQIEVVLEFLQLLRKRTESD